MSFVSLVSAFVLVISLAFYQAESKYDTIPDLDVLKVGLTSEEVIERLGVPLQQDTREFIYSINQVADLVINFQNNLVSFATLRFQKPFNINNPTMQKLSLVEIAEDSNWFYAANPEKGEIWKINSRGIVESRSWVPTFNNHPSKPKALQALLREFQTKQTVSL